MRMHVWIETAGLGHVTRQINLARAMREADPAVAVLFFSDGNPAIVNKLTAAGEKLLCVSENPSAAVSEIRTIWTHDRPSLFLLDSATLHRVAAVQELLLTDGQATVCIVDEITLSGVRADLVINALPGDPAQGGEQRVLRGSEYIIQDSDVARYHHMPKETPATPRKGFAFFGGMDGNDFSSIFIEAIVRSGCEISWKLLVGPLYKEFGRLSQRIRETGVPVSVEREVQSVARELWEADIAVIAAGNTLSESVGVGTPCLCLAQTDEQSHNADFFSKSAGAVFVGAAGQSFPYPTSQSAVHFRDFDHAASLLSAALNDLSGDFGRRAAIRGRMLKSIDGQGAQRIASILVGMFGD